MLRYPNERIWHCTNVIISVWGRPLLWTSLWVQAHLQNSIKLPLALIFWLKNWPGKGEFSSYRCASTKWSAVLNLRLISVKWNARHKHENKYNVHVYGNFYFHIVWRSSYFAFSRKLLWWELNDSVLGSIVLAGPTFSISIVDMGYWRKHWIQRYEQEVLQGRWRVSSGIWCQPSRNIRLSGTDDWTGCRNSLHRQTRNTIGSCWQ